MPWFTKKKKKKKDSKFQLFWPYSRPISTISGMFRPFPACIGCQPIRPDSGRINPVWCELKLIRHESSRIGANQAESVQIREKKKMQTQTDARATASYAGAAPEVPRPCFLGFNTNLTNSHNFQLTTKKNPLNSTEVFCFLGKKQFLCRNNMVVTAKFPNLTPHPGNIIICNMLTLF